MRRTPTDDFTVAGLATGESIASVPLSSPGAAADAPVLAAGYSISLGDPVAGVGTDLDNYSITLVPGTLRVLYRWDGYLQPINDTAHMTGESRASSSSARRSR